MSSNNPRRFRIPVFRFPVFWFVREAGPGSGPGRRVMCSECNRLRQLAQWAQGLSDRQHHARQQGTQRRRAAPDRRHATGVLSARRSGAVMVLGLSCSPYPEQGTQCRRAAPDRPVSPEASQCLAAHLWCDGRALLQRLHTRMKVRCGDTIKRRPHLSRCPPAIGRCPFVAVAKAVCAVSETARGRDGG